MKILKNVFLFILKVAVITGILILSAVGWVFLILLQTPGSLFHPEPIPIYLKLLDLLILLPLNFGLIIFTAVLLSRVGVDKDKSRKTPPWKKIATPSAIIAAAVAICVLISLKDTIKEKYVEISVKADVARADEIITYENSGDLYGDALFDSEIYRASMLLDYDKMTVTFLYRMSWEHNKRVQLFENGFVPNDDHILQFKNPLRGGGEVKVYYDKNGDKTSLRPSFKTCAVTVERFGKIYGAHFDPEPMEFESCLEDIYAMEDRNLETIAYRENEMPLCAGNVKSDTVFLDPENGKLYLVYVDMSGFGVANVRVDECELVETNKVEDVFIQAEFDLKNGNKLYAFGNEDHTRYANDPIMHWRSQITDGLALKYNGKLYITEFGINSCYGFLNSTGAVGTHKTRTTIE